MNNSISVPNSVEYVNLTILTLEDFEIDITEKQKNEMLALPTEIAVDRYKTKLIKEKLYSI